MHASIKQERRIVQLSENTWTTRQISLTNYWSHLLDKLLVRFTWTTGHIYLNYWSHLPNELLVTFTWGITVLNQWQWPDCSHSCNERNIAIELTLDRIVNKDTQSLDITCQQNHFFISPSKDNWQTTRRCLYSSIKLRWDALVQRSRDKYQQRR